MRAMCRQASPVWRAAIAWAALRELDPDDAAIVATSFLPAGPPLPAFDGVMVEAAFWADMATPDEHAAYCLACFSRLSDDRRAAFLRHVQRGAA